jgi:hypothetical protein
VSAEARRLVSRERVVRRWANVVRGLGGVLEGGFQGFLRETWLAFLPRSMPRRTRCGDTGGAGAGATCVSLRRVNVGGDLVVETEKASRGLGLLVVLLGHASAILLISSSSEPFSVLIALLSASI